MTRLPISETTELRPLIKLILDKALELDKCGLMGMDALHIACAQKAKVDFFITCDDNLLKKLKRVDNSGLKCYNIIDFISREVFKR